MESLRRVKKEKKNDKKNVFYLIFVHNAKYKLIALATTVLVWLLVAGL